MRLRLLFSTFALALPRFCAPPLPAECTVWCMLQLALTLLPCSRANSRRFLTPPSILNPDTMFIHMLLALMLALLLCAPAVSARATQWTRAL